MLWYNWKKSAFFFTIFVISIITSSLAGCDFRPIYATIPGNVPIQNELASIEIVAGTYLRNELIFLLNQTNKKIESKYRLRVTTTERESAVSIERLADVPASYLVTITGNFSLTEIDSGQTILTGTSFASASLDYSSQRLANLRSRRDASHRAQKVIARDLRSRLAAYLERRNTFELSKES